MSLATSVALELDSQGVTAMHRAAERGDLACLEQLYLSGASVSVKDARGGEPLLEAAAAGSVDSMKWLLSHGADINSCDERGDTALHVAAGYGHLKAIQWLLQNGAQVDARTKVNVTPLLYATAKGRIEAVQLLLEFGADAFAMEEERGWNAIHIAAGCNQSDMVRFLAKKFPGLVESKTRDGKSARTVAIEEKCPDSFLAIEESFKGAQKILRKKRLEEARRLQAEQDALSRQRAMEDADRLARELELFDSSQASKGSSKRKKKKNSNQKGSKRNNNQEKTSVAGPLKNSTVENTSPTIKASKAKVDSDSSDEESRDPETTAPRESSANHLQIANAVVANNENLEPGEGEWIVVKDARKTSRERKEARKKERHDKRQRERKARSSSQSISSASSSASSSCSSSKEEKKQPSIKKEKPKVTVDMNLIAASTDGGPLSSPTKRKFENRWTLGSSTKSKAGPDGSPSFSTDGSSPSFRETSSSSFSKPSPRVQSTTSPSPTVATAIPKEGLDDECDAIVDQNIAQASEEQKEQVETSPDAVLTGGTTSKSRLRPHAPPWSPRRRRWTSPAANAGQVKAKILVDQPPEVVDNEFQRMLKKFVHMDTGARRTAKRKFAKATADYEEKRLADAEQMEQTWRTSVKAKLKRGSKQFLFQLLQETLDDIQATEEARCLHIGKEPHSTLLNEDLELAELVEQAKAILLLQNQAPLQDYSKQWPSGVLVVVPASLSRPLDEDPSPCCSNVPSTDVLLAQSLQFENQLRHSVEVWRKENQNQCVWLRFGLDQTHLVHTAAKVGFDFEHARPGYVIMKYLLLDDKETAQEEGEGECEEDDQPKVTLSKQASVGVVVIKRTKTKSGMVTHVLLRQRRKKKESKSRQNAKWALPAKAVLSGEDPGLVAETLVRELCGYAVSPHVLEGKGCTFFCSVHVDETEEKVFDQQPAGDTYSWERVKQLASVLEEPQYQACKKLVETE